MKIYVYCRKCNNHLFDLQTEQAEKTRDFMWGYYGIVANFHFSKHGIKKIKKSMFKFMKEVEIKP